MRAALPRQVPMLKVELHSHTSDDPDELTLRLAETVGPPELRSLDAIHLAAALSIGDYPEAFVTYDRRLASAARAIGLNVVTPSA